MNVKLNLTIEQYNTIKTALLEELFNRESINPNDIAIPLLKDALEGVNNAVFNHN